MSGLEFKCKVPETFLEDMIAFWTRECKESRTVVDPDFEDFCDRVVGKACTFKIDNDYAGKESSNTHCCEVYDDNFVIPISILELSGE